MRRAADFSTETWRARRDWQDIFKVLTEKNLQPGILYPARQSFRIEREIRNFPTKNYRHSDHKLVLQASVKGTLLLERKEHSEAMKAGNTKVVQISVSIQKSVQELTK